MGAPEGGGLNSDRDIGGSAPPTPPNCGGVARGHFGADRAFEGLAPRHGGGLSADPPRRPAVLGRRAGGTARLTRALIEPPLGLPAPEGGPGRRLPDVPVVLAALAHGLRRPRRPLAVVRPQHAAVALIVHPRTPGSSADIPPNHGQTTI